MSGIPAADSTTWAAALASQLGRAIRSIRPVTGGEIGRSFKVLLEDGEAIFVKHYPDAPPGLSQSERAGLDWLAETRTLRVVRAITTGEEWLALEWIESAPAAQDYAERLGRGLARMHLAGSDQFGHDDDGWLAMLPQSNRPHREWSRFYAEERIRPLTKENAEMGLLSAALRDRLFRLCDQMEQAVGPPERPARLHGDLWSGNVLTDEQGQPCLIDPAAHAGHREVDLAMMRLFGGFPPVVFEAYEAEAPLAPGWQLRVPLYQLWPLLVHVRLFGSGYRRQLEDRLDAVLGAPGEHA
jgi:fructosamine-3-kinase